MSNLEITNHPLYLSLQAEKSTLQQKVDELETKNLRLQNKILELEDEINKCKKGKGGAKSFEFHI